MISADDFARQLPLAELAAHAGNAAVTARVVICSARAESSDPNRTGAQLPTDASMRELASLVRRNLRSTDSVAIDDRELFILLEGMSVPADAVADRLVAAVRGHLFAAGAVGHLDRLTLSLGLASAPEHGTSFTALVAAAREARMSVGGDGWARAHSGPARALDLNRFAGRAEPLALLFGHLEDTARGAGRVVAIVGETGVGTSSLVRMLTPEVRLRGGSLIVASCRQTRFTAPYALWSEVLRAARRLPVKSARVWRELPSLDPTLERASDEGRGGSKTLLLEELAEYLRLGAQQRPLVLLLEDMHWADTASWDALEYLIAQLESERILLALTFQSGTPDDALERWERLASRPRHSEIRLTHLTRDDVKRWLEAAMRTKELGRDLLAYLYRHSEGNPLALTHLVRDLEESGHVVQAESGWQWSAVSELPAPLALAELLGRRIARLRPSAREVLEIAAVLGREFDERLLLATGVLEADVDEALRELLERGMLVPTYDRGKAAYVLSHHAVARVAESRLSSTRAAALHGRVAQALVEHGRHLSAEIAGHFEIAAMRVDAHRYALKAADEAVVLHETLAVAELLAAAERNAPTDSALADVRVRMAAEAEVSGQHERVETLCEQALAWYEGQGAWVQALRLKIMQVRVRMQRGQAARDILENLFVLEAEAREVNADAERASILLLISQTHWRLGDLRSAQRVAADSVEIAERGTDALLISDSCNRLAVTIQLENPQRARELFTRSLEIATGAGEAVRRVRALNNIGVLELITNNWDDARHMLTLAADQARTARLIGPWGRAELNLGVLAGRLGDYEGAARALAEALRLTAMVQNGEDQMYATYNLAHNERESSHLREAADTYSLVAELAERIGQVEVRAGALAGFGLCKFLMGDVDAARESLARAAPMMERLVEWFQGRELMEALRIHLLVTDEQMSDALVVFERALVAAGPIDAYGAAWLAAEFGEAFLGHLPEDVEAAVRVYARRPEVLGNPRLRKLFSALKIDT